MQCSREYASNEDKRGWTHGSCHFVPNSQLLFPFLYVCTLVYEPVYSTAALLVHALCYTESHRASCIHDSAGDCMLEQLCKRLSTIKALPFSSYLLKIIVPPALSLPFLYIRFHLSRFSIPNCMNKQLRLGWILKFGFFYQPLNNILMSNVAYIEGKYLLGNLQ